MKIIIPVCLLLLAVSCQDDAQEAETLMTDDAITGTWLYTEYGYSPGSGYFTEPVPPLPAQTLTLSPNFTLSTNLQTLKNFRFYRIFEDPASENPVIAFYRDDPGQEDQDIMQLEHSYAVVQEGKTLKLYFRWCIEGCHIGFEKISSAK